MRSTLSRAARQRTDWDALERVRWAAGDTLDPEQRLASTGARWGNLDAWIAARALAGCSAARAA